MEATHSPPGSVKRVCGGVAVGLLALAGIVWVLTRTLGNAGEPEFSGKPAWDWETALKGADAAASNRACVVLNSQVIPQLVNTMFHDTNDFRPRLLPVDALNNLPGVNIYFNPAAGRRSLAARVIGEFGPPAKAAVPALIRALQGSDTSVHEAAIAALGRIHSDPETVIPLLTACLDNENLNDEAAGALAHYGSLAKPAVPKIIPLLKARDKDAREAAHKALLAIDPDAAAKAGVKAK